jgi:hypothetical protein
MAMLSILSCYHELMQAWFQGTLETESVMAKSEDI